MKMASKTSSRDEASLRWQVKQVKQVKSLGISTSKSSLSASQQASQPSQHLNKQVNPLGISTEMPTLCHLKQACDGKPSKSSLLAISTISTPSQAFLPSQPHVKTVGLSTHVKPFASQPHVKPLQLLNPKAAKAHKAKPRHKAKAHEAKPRHMRQSEGT